MLHGMADRGVLPHLLAEWADVRVQIVTFSCILRNFVYLLFFYAVVKLISRFDVGLSRSTTKPARPNFIFRRHGWTAIVHRWEEPAGKTGH